MGAKAQTYAPVDVEALENNEEHYAMTNAYPVAAVGVPHFTVTGAKSKVELVAPADLEGGYEFSVDVDGRTLLVQVPDGGVLKGQDFMATVVEEDNAHVSRNDLQGVPVGAWRDGICDCCIHGCCHPVVWLSYCCSPLALGQVMTRMGLDWKATPINSKQSHLQGGLSTFRILAIVVTCYVVTDFGLQLIISMYNQQQINNMAYPQDEAAEIPVGVMIVTILHQLLVFVFGIYMIVIGIRTRAYIRAKYAIPEQYCTGCDDFCATFFCACCSTSQLLRHTADYRKYKAACCTDTGLPDDSLMIV